jgi:hypothetical protein
VGGSGGAVARAGLTWDMLFSEGDDLKASQAQNAAMGQAKTSLEAATKKALKANAGSRAISVVPSIDAGHAVGAVTLAGSQGTKTVSEGLQ